MKDQTKILLTENIHSIASEILIQEGYEVTRIQHAPDEAELVQLLPRYDLVGIRSKTHLTQKALEASQKLMCVGCFCIGTNQVDLSAARRQGIPVFNAPHSNTRSVAELVLAEMIMLSRQLGDRNNLAHAGSWLKSADGAHEVRGKTLGIVGYGHIGSQLSVLAEALGLRVLFYDVVKKLPLGNARPMNSLKDLLAQSDFISLHVPETDQTKKMISSLQFQSMKKGSYLINASRGTVIDIEDLVLALRENHLAGAALDVFPEEPASTKDRFLSPLQNMKNVILTPHIGGSTEEAQYAIGVEVAESFRRYLQVGTTTGSVNFPGVELPRRGKSTRILNVHRNEPGVLGQINSLVSEAGLNIQAQYLSTDNEIGYMVMDLEDLKNESLVDSIQNLNRSVRTRKLG
jgi:D-3-phosphoglycerate dehydrogenase